MKPFPKGIKKLLVRSTNWIGDAVMTSPAIRTIRQNFPDTEITLLASPWVADVFQASPYVDRIFLYRKKDRHGGLMGKFRLAMDLKPDKFDGAILLQNAFEAAFITFLARIPVRGGYTTDGRGILLTHGIRINPDVKQKHQVNYYQEMLKGLGLTPGENDLEISVADESLQWARAMLLDQAASGIKTVIGLNPGAAYGPAKRWPSEKFAALADQLCHDSHTLILVFGTDADSDAAEQISTTVTNKNNVLNLTGKTSLAQAMGLISLCDAFVTNDSGLMHVSAALKTATVAVFGSTNPVTTGPYSDNASIVRTELDCSPCLKTHCPQKHFKCMENIEVNDVLHTLRNLMNTLNKK